MVKRVFVGISVLLIGLVVVSPGLAAPPAQAIRSVITYPASNATVSGVVEVRGIATHPSADWWYNVSYAPGGEPAGDSQWVTLAQVDDTLVEDGVLATWDTTTVPDGLYTLVLTVKAGDDPTYWQHFSTNLTVSNARPAGAVTPEQAATPQPMPTAAAGLTPTPVTIQQPPTPTPRSSAGTESETGGEGATEELPAETGDGTSTGGQSADWLSPLRSGFCSGGVIALMLFLLWGLYTAARFLVRWYHRSGSRPSPPAARD